MPDDAVKKMVSHKCGVVVTLTHDPKLDDMALQQLGLSPVQLARLHGPVGLPIGSNTPAEIAVAVMAGIIAARHGVTNDVK